MADIVQKFKTPSGDNIIDKDFADFKESGGTIGGDIEISRKIRTTQKYFDLRLGGDTHGISYVNDGTTDKRLIPSTSEDQNLGSGGNRWKALYTKRVFLTDNNADGDITNPEKTGSLGLGVTCGDGTALKVVFTSGNVPTDSTFRPATSSGNLIDLGSGGAPWKNIWVSGYSRTTDGFSYLPNGMIMQWGEQYMANGGTATITYPIKFPNNMRSLQLTSRWGSANNLVLVSGSATDNLANFVVRPNSESVAYTVQWFAIGY